MEPTGVGHLFPNHQFPLDDLPQVDRQRELQMLNPFLREVPSLAAPSNVSVPNPDSAKDPKSSPASPLSFLQYKKITDLKHAFMDPRHHMLKSHPISPATQSALKSVMEENIIFQVQGTRGGYFFHYLLIRPLGRLLTHFFAFTSAHGMVVTSRRIIGSGCPHLLGSEGLQKILKKEVPECAEIPAFHIDAACDDLDLFLEYSSNSAQTAINPSEGFVDDLINEHHRILKFKVSFDDGSLIIFNSFETLVIHLIDAPSKNIKQIAVVDCPIAWLQCKLTGRSLHNFTEDLEKNRSALRKRDSHYHLETHLCALALVHIFQTTADEMKKLINTSALAYAHSIFELNPVKGMEVPTRDWFRIPCTGERGKNYDFIFFKSSLTPTRRVEFQNAYFEIPEDPQHYGSYRLHATTQALFDKTHKLLRWVKWSFVNVRDFAAYCDYLAESYIDVEPKTVPFLLAGMETAPINRLNRSRMDLLIDAILLRMHKRKTAVQVFGLLYMISTLLPEKVYARTDHVRLWTECFKIDIQRTPLQVNDFLKALFDGDLEFRSIAALLFSIAQQKNQTVSTEHCGREAFRFHIGKCAVLNVSSSADQFKYLVRASFKLTDNTLNLVQHSMRGIKQTEVQRETVVNSFLDLLPHLDPSPLCTRDELLEVWRAGPIPFIARLLSESHEVLNQTGFLAWHTFAPAKSTKEDLESLRLLELLAPLNLPNALKIIPQTASKESVRILFQAALAKPDLWKSHLQSLVHRALSAGCLQIPLTILEEFIQKRQVLNTLFLIHVLAQNSITAPEWVCAIDKLQRGTPDPFQTLETLQVGAPPLFVYSWLQLQLQTSTVRILFEEQCAERLRDASSDAMAADLLSAWNEASLFDNSYTPARLWIARCTSQLQTGLPAVVQTWESGFRKGFLHLIPYSFGSPFLSTFLKMLLASKEKEHIHLSKELMARISLEGNEPLDPQILSQAQQEQHARKFERMLQDKNPRELLKHYQKVDLANCPCTPELLQLILTALRKLKLSTAEIEPILQRAVSHLHQIQVPLTLEHLLPVYNGLLAWIDQKRFNEANLLYTYFLKTSLESTSEAILVNILRKTNMHPEFEELNLKCLQILLTHHTKRWNQILAKLNVAASAAEVLTHALLKVKPDPIFLEIALHLLNASKSSSDKLWSTILKAIRSLEIEPPLKQKAFEIAAKRVPPTDLVKNTSHREKWIAFETELDKLQFALYAAIPTQSGADRIREKLKQLRQTDGGINAHFPDKSIYRVRLSHFLKNCACSLAKVFFKPHEAGLLDEMQQARADLESYLAYPQVVKVRNKLDFQLTRAFCRQGSAPHIFREGCLLFGKVFITLSPDKAAQNIYDYMGVLLRLGLRFSSGETPDVIETLKKVAHHFVKVHLPCFDLFNLIPTLCEYPQIAFHHVAAYIASDQMERPPAQEISKEKVQEILLTILFKLSQSCDPTSLTLLKALLNHRNILEYIPTEVRNALIHMLNLRNLAGIFTARADLILVSQSLWKQLEFVRTTHFKPKNGKQEWVVNNLEFAKLIKEIQPAGVCVPLQDSPELIMRWAMQAYLSHLLKSQDCTVPLKRENLQYMQGSTLPPFRSSSQGFCSETSEIGFLALSKPIQELLALPNDSTALTCVRICYLWQILKQIVQNEPAHAAEIIPWVKEFITVKMEEGSPYIPLQLNLSKLLYQIATSAELFKNHPLAKAELEQIVAP